MNEQELKEIWKSGEPSDLQNVDFEKIRKNIKTWQDKLRRKIKTDIFLNLLTYILLLPFFYFMPKLVYLTPVMAIIWAWYLWELLRIYKLETKSFGVENTKLHLEKKKNYLKNYIFRTRLILYVSTPFIILLSLWIFISSKAVVENPAVIAVGIILVEILVAVICEIYVRLVYSPSVKKLEDLLLQLE